MKKHQKECQSDRFLNLPSSRSVSLLTTLPSLSKLRSSSLITWQTNSTKSIVTNKLELLSKLKQRKNSSLELLPSIVSNSLRKYFIPMLEAQRQRKLNLKTFNTNIHKQSLCEFLEAELEKSIILLESLRGKLINTNKDTVKKKQEIEELKGKLLNFNSNIECSNFLMKKNNRHRFSVIDKDLLTPFKKSNENLKEKSKKFYEEKIKNNSLKDKAVNLRHFNSLFLMQSDIMGERLKGLYFACDSLSKKNLKSLFSSEKNKIVKFSHTIFAVHQSNLNLLSTCLQSFTQSIKSTSLIIIKNSEIEDDIKKIKFKIKDNVESLNLKIVKNKEEKEEAINNFKELDKKIMTFEDEYERTRKKLIELKAKNKHYGEREEKICKYCKSVFIEKENFNWSCKVHISEWSGTNYWCCGANKQDAIGCQTSKHIASEDIEDIPEEKELHSGKKSSEKCKFCRKTGHSFNDCPKDPNSLLLKNGISLKQKTKIKTFTQRINFVTQYKKNKNFGEIDEKNNDFDDILSARNQAIVESFVQTPRYPLDD